MSFYIKLSTFEYPRHEGDIRVEHPEIGKEFVCPPTYALVQDVPWPEWNPSTHRVVELPPIRENGVWKKNYKTIEYTQEEKNEIENLRKQHQEQLNIPGEAPIVIG